MVSLRLGDGGLGRGAEVERGAGGGGLELVQPSGGEACAVGGLGGAVFRGEVVWVDVNLEGVLAGGQQHAQQGNEAQGAGAASGEIGH